MLCGKKIKKIIAETGEKVNDAPQLGLLHFGLIGKSPAFSQTGFVVDSSSI